MSQVLSEGFVLRAKSGHDSPVLQGVELRGRLEGLLFSVTLRQTYRNLSLLNLEVVYTFPLPSNAVVLGMAAELGQGRLEARVLPRNEAEEVYESALGQGDMPILLEAGPGGLYTANLGNLKPQEAVVLELRFAQLVTFDQGRMRLSVPMTVSPRYGNLPSSGMAPHQVPVSNLGADYPLDFSVQVTGPMAEATLECPTHLSVQTRGDGWRQLRLAHVARLDRDVVLLVNGDRAPSYVSWAWDEMAEDRARTQVVVAAFQLPDVLEQKTLAEGGLRLKLLVDCSGSMAGDSMTSAKRALMGVAKSLQTLDEVSYSRFGDEFRLELPSVRCDWRGLQALRSVIGETEANLGGTEMENALLSAMSIPALGLGGQSSDLLLITDGEVWETRGVLTAAQRSAHRVFVLGVGSSPAYDLLARLAQATGGACEFATPGENLEAAALRLVQKMRQPRWTALAVDLGFDRQPKWQVPLPAGGFPGETVLTMAGFEVEDRELSSPTEFNVRLSQGGDKERRILLNATEGTRIDDTALAHDLIRVVGASRMARALGQSKARNEGEALSLAMSYQLLSPHTHCVLVHARSEADKSEDDAHLHRVQSMLAAGWGGTGSVSQSVGRHLRLSHSVCGVGAAYRNGLNTPSVWRAARTALRPSQEDAWGDLEVPAYLRLEPLSVEEVESGLDIELTEAVATHATLRQVAEALDGHLSRGDSPPLRTVLSKLRIHPKLQAVITEMEAVVPNEPTRWYLLHFWLYFGVELSKKGILEGGAKRYGVPLETMAEAMDTLAKSLGGVDLDGWGNQRQTRLQRAMSAFRPQRTVPLVTKGWGPLPWDIQEIEIPGFLRRQAD
jgi:Ca-activated chloride channel homolog